MQNYTKRNEICGFILRYQWLVLHGIENNLKVELLVMISFIRYLITHLNRRQSACSDGCAEAVLGHDEYLIPTYII